MWLPFIRSNESVYPVFIMMYRIAGSVYGLLNTMYFILVIVLITTIDSILLSLVTASLIISGIFTLFWDRSFNSAKYCSRFRNCEVPWCLDWPILGIIPSYTSKIFSGVDGIGFLCMISWRASGISEGTDTEEGQFDVREK